MWLVQVKILLDTSNQNTSKNIGTVIPYRFFNILMKMFFTLVKHTFAGFYGNQLFALSSIKISTIHDSRLSCERESILISGHLTDQDTYLCPDQR